MMTLDLTGVEVTRNVLHPTVGGYGGQMIEKLSEPIDVQELSKIANSGNNWLFKIDLQLDDPDIPDFLMEYGRHFFKTKEKEEVTIEICGQKYSDFKFEAQTLVSSGGATPQGVVVLLITVSQG